MWCCLYPRSFDCCPVDPHAWKRDVKMCALGPTWTQQTNLSASCNRHGCNDHMFQRILLQNSVRNDSTQNIWDKSARVPLCENFEKYGIEAKRRNAKYSLQPLMTKSSNDHELIKQLLKSHPAGYKYACKCEHTMTGSCKCKRRGLEMNGSYYSGIY